MRYYVKRDVPEKEWKMGQVVDLTEDEAREWKTALELADGDDQPDDLANVRQPGGGIDAA